MSQMLPTETDVFVVGGGPAGLAVAIAARRKGFRVVVADGAKPPIDKACGEGLLPDSLRALHALGIQVPAVEGSEFRGIRFVGAHLSADAIFPAGGCGLAVRRPSLHGLMTQRAEQAGAELFWQTCVTGVAHEGVHVGERFVRARWIVGADGANSRVRQWAGLNHGPKPTLRYAFRRHYRVRPWTEHMEVYWGKRCQGYATAVGKDEVCVAVASRDPNLRSDRALRELPDLGARLQHAPIVSAERGALTGNRRFHAVWRGKVALVGDASGTVDAITGEGLGLGFSQGLALADSFASNDLSKYQISHERISIRSWWMARLMLLLDGRPRLQHRVLRTFRARPKIFQRFLALHVGSLPPAEIVWDGLALGWGLLTA